MPQDMQRAIVQGIDTSERPIDHDDALVVHLLIGIKQDHRTLDQLELVGVAAEVAQVTQHIVDPGIRRDDDLIVPIQAAIHPAVEKHPHIGFARHAIADDGLQRLDVDAALLDPDRIAPENRFIWQAFGVAKRQELSKRNLGTGGHDILLLSPINNRIPIRGPEQVFARPAFPPCLRRARIMIAAMQPGEPVGRGPAHQRAGGLIEIDVMTDLRGYQRCRTAEQPSTDHRDFHHQTHLGASNRHDSRGARTLMPRCTA